MKKKKPFPTPQKKKTNHWSLTTSITQTSPQGITVFLWAHLALVHYHRPLVSHKAVMSSCLPINIFTEDKM